MRGDNQNLNEGCLFSFATSGLRQQVCSPFRARCCLTAWGSELVPGGETGLEDQDGRFPNAGRCRCPPPEIPSSDSLGAGSLMPFG